MNAGAFLRDLEAKPAALRRLAGWLRVDDPWRAVPRDVRRAIVLGMGSSRFASLGATPRLRAAGIDAVAEYAGAREAHPGGPGTLAVAISASGRTQQTVAAARRHRDAGSLTVALTEDRGSPLGEAADVIVELAAGSEEGGVACRSFQHTVVHLLAMRERLTGGSVGDVAAAAERAAAATEDLLGRRDAWLGSAVERLTTTGSAFLVAPAERRSSAEQGALMFREGPRLVADACETADWSHVDVYLTKPLDYRALVFAGSHGDEELMRWIRERRSTVVAVGGELPGAEGSIRYRHDDDEVVALITEILVPELVAASAWVGQGGTR